MHPGRFLYHAMKSITTRCLSLAVCRAYGTFGLVNQLKCDESYPLCSKLHAHQLFEVFEWL